MILQHDPKQTWRSNGSRKMNACVPTSTMNQKQRAVVRKNRSRIINNSRNKLHHGTHLYKRLDAAKKPIVVPPSISNNMKRKPHNITVDGKVFRYDPAARAYRYQYTDFQLRNNISSCDLPPWNPFSVRVQNMKPNKTGNDRESKHMRSRYPREPSEFFCLEVEHNRGETSRLCEGISTLFMNDPTKEILWDTGATASVAFSKDDFDDGIIIPSPCTRVMKGLATGL